MTSSSSLPETSNYSVEPGTSAAIGPNANGLFQIDNLSVQHLSLPLAADSDDIAGTLDGQWSIDVNELTPDGILAPAPQPFTTSSSEMPANPPPPNISPSTKSKSPAPASNTASIEIQPITITRKIRAPTPASSQNAHSPGTSQATVDHPDAHPGP